MPQELYANQGAAPQMAPPAGAWLEGGPDINVVSPNDIRHDSPESRYGDVIAALRANNEPGALGRALAGERVPESLVRGDWGANDRGTQDIVDRVLPRRPATTAQGQFANPYDMPRDPRYIADPRAFTGAETTSPYQDLGMHQTPPGTYVPPPAAPTGYPQSAYDAQFTGPGATAFGGPRTANEAWMLQKWGDSQREIGELRALFTETLEAVRRPTASAGPMTPDEALSTVRTQLGLNGDDDTPLSRRDVAQALGALGANLYASQMAAMDTVRAEIHRSVKPVDSATEGQILAGQPWLRGLEKSDPARYNDALRSLAPSLRGRAAAANGNGPFAPAGYGGVPAGYQPAPGGVPFSGARYVERGAQVNLESLRTRPSPADDILQRRARGEYVSTEEMRLALRRAGLAVGK